MKRKNLKHTRYIVVPRLYTILIGTIGLWGYFFLIPAHAYIGPGAGVTMLGALWGVILAIIFAVGGLLIWPIRALLRRRKRRTIASEVEIPGKETEK